MHYIGRIAMEFRYIRDCNMSAILFNRSELFEHEDDINNPLLKLGIL